MTNFHSNNDHYPKRHMNKKSFDLGTQNDIYKVGQKVEHMSFGKGRILSIRKDGELIKLTISFDSGELKK